MVIAGELRKWGDVSQRVQNSSYKMSKFWGSDIWDGNFGLQYCIISLKVAKKVDLICSHPKKQLVIM